VDLLSLDGGERYHTLAALMHIERTEREFLLLGLHLDERWDRISRIMHEITRGFASDNTAGLLGGTYRNAGVRWKAAYSCPRKLIRIEPAIHKDAKMDKRDFREHKVATT